MKSLIYPVNEVDSFESYFHNFLFWGKTMIIPYINLGISEHPLNTGSKLKFINKAYVVFMDIKDLVIRTLDNESLKENYPKSSLETCYLGGINLDEKSKVTGFEIRAERSFIHLLHDSKIASHLWIPTYKGKLERNISEQEVLDFFYKKNILKDLEKILSP